MMLAAILFVYLFGCGVILIATHPKRLRYVLGLVGLSVRDDLLRSNRTADKLRSSLSQQAVIEHQLRKEIEEMHNEMEAIFSSSRYFSFNPSSIPMNFEAVAEISERNDVIRIHMDAIFGDFSISVKELENYRHLPSFLNASRTVLHKKWNDEIAQTLERVLSVEAFTKLLKGEKPKKRRRAA